MVETLLYVIFFLSCLVLIGTILLQPGKTDAGALFTSNISSTAFGPRGTQTILSKITIGAAAVFMLTALLLSMAAITGKISVLQTTSGTPATSTAPAAEASNTAVNSAPANVANSAPANTANNTDANASNANTGNANTANSGK